MRLRRLVVVILASMGRVLGAQSAPDSAQCRAALDAASPDSQSTRVSMLVVPYDTANRLSPAYAGLIGVGIRQFLSLPRPMPLHAYDRTLLVHEHQGDLGFVTATVRGAYHATLHRDGHLSRIGVVSGTRDEAFDTAVVQAMKELSASELLPPPEPPAATFTGDSLDLRILVMPEAQSLLPQVVSTPPAEGVTPVLLLRLPIRRITQQARAKPNGPTPVYPTVLRTAGVGGSTLFEFVVDTSGRVELGSVAVLKSSAPQFIDAVADILPYLRFDPLRVDGCPVSVLMQQPFDFNVRAQPVTSPARVDEPDRRRASPMRRERT